MIDNMNGVSSDKIIIKVNGVDKEFETGFFISETRLDFV